MNNSRRAVRKIVARMLGAPADIRIYWPPDLPLVYANNPKAGCSTIKTTMKAAQARIFEGQNRPFERNPSPHEPDDCVRSSSLPGREHDSRFLFSCARNPYARALSGYLDKVQARPDQNFRELRGTKVETFEDHLAALVGFEPADMNGHFRPQHCNLGLPEVRYDAIFFLENLQPFAELMQQAMPVGSAEMTSFAPHARSALSRLKEHFTPRAVDLVQRVYARDFELLGYSRALDDAAKSPGLYIRDGQIVADGAAGLRLLPSPGGRRRHNPAFRASLRYMRLIERRLI